MHILMTGDAVGGVWTYALDLARGLGPAGVEVTLATMGPLPSVEQRQEAASIPNLQLHASELRLEWMDDPWADVDRAGIWLRELAERLDPDLIHLNGYVHGSLDWQRPTVMVAHSCVLSWWLAVKGEPAPARYDRYRHRVSEGLDGADVVVAPTAAMLSQIEQLYPVTLDGRVIANSRWPDGLFAAPARPYVFAAGRVWDDAKNFAALDRCAGHLPWRVYLAGSCQLPDGSTVRPQHATALGTLSAGGVACWLAHASICALPARYEPFGLSALEAAMSDCALVLGDIPSLREVWGDAAIFVDPDDDDDLAGAIDELIANELLRTQLIRRARERARRYGVDAMAASYLALYAELIAGSAVRPTDSQTAGEP